MAKLINAKCPNCGAVLELPANLDRAFCMHCGGKVIIAKDVHYHGGKPAIACPECKGKGYIICSNKTKIKKIRVGGLPYSVTAYSCNGTGMCNTKNDYGYVRCDNGICLDCHGKGESFLYKCKVCNRTGKCPFCKGTGKCIFCNGKGRHECKACNGTGFKVYKGE